MKKVAAKKEMTADQLEKQINVLERALSNFPQEENLSKDEKNRYYPIKGKIKNLKNQLHARKQFEHLAR